MAAQGIQENQHLGGVALARNLHRTGAPAPIFVLVIRVSCP